MIRGLLALLAGSALAAMALAWAPDAFGQPLDPEEIRRRHEKFSKLFDEALEELSTRKLDSAIAKFKECHELVPAIPAAPYNVACGYSLKNDQPEALRWLTAAITSGFYDFGHIERDADLENVRKHPGFRALIDSSKALIDSKIKTVLYAPAKLDKTKPAALIIALHGYGDTAAAYIEQWKGVADSRSLVVSVPEGTLTVTKQGGFAYASELVKRGVMKAYREALRAHNIDRARVWIAGFSQGGDLAFRTALASPDLFTGVIAISAEFTRDTWVAETLTDLQLEGGRVLDLYVIHGEYAVDSLLGARRAVREHRDAGFSSNLARFPGTRGWPPERTKALEAAVDWIVAEMKARNPKPVPVKVEDF